MKEKRVWGWPVACYLFLGGLGGGMIIVSSVADIFWRVGKEFALGSLCAAVAIALGSGLLMFDLGRPIYFWRVFSRQKAVMTVGAWILGLLILTSVLYFSFWLNCIPWRDLHIFRQILAWLNSFLGLGVCLYTGILLGSMKARPFWNTPVLPVLFLISGLSIGIAAQSLLAGSWPYTGVRDLEETHVLLKSIDLGLIVLEIIVVFVYVLMMRTSFGEDAAHMADSLLKGGKKLAFWGGLIGLGLLLPAILYVVPAQELVIKLAFACVLAGGLILRFLLVYSNKRKTLPDEI